MVLFYLTWWQVSKRQKSKQMHTKKKKDYVTNVKPLHQAKLIFFYFVLLLQFCSLSPLEALKKSLLIHSIHLP